MDARILGYIKQLKGKKITIEDVGEIIHAR